MDIQAEKLSLVQIILNIKDISLLKDIRTLVETYDNDWFNELSEDQQQSVLNGLAQADRGEGIPHEEAITRLGL